MDPTAMGIIGGIITFILIMVPMYWYVEEPELKKKLDKKRKQKKIEKGILKSDAFIRGYGDMGKALCDLAYLPYCGDNTFVRFDDSYLERMAKNYNGSFKPQTGRTCTGYLSGTSKEFEDYYAGGLQLLDDVDSMQAKIIERDAVIEQRRLGLEQFDRQTIEAKKELDKLRNKAYNIQEEHREFDKLLPKKSIWRRNKEAA